MTRWTEFPKVGQVWRDHKYSFNTTIVRVRKYWWHKDDLLSERFSLVSEPKQYRYINRNVSTLGETKYSSNTRHAPNVEVVTLMHSMKAVARSVFPVVGQCVAVGALIGAVMGMVITVLSFLIK